MTRGGIFFPLFLRYNLYRTPFGFTWPTCSASNEGRGKLDSGGCAPARALSIGARFLRRRPAGSADSAGGSSPLSDIGKKAQIFPPPGTVEEIFLLRGGSSKAGRDFLRQGNSANGFVRNLPQAEREPLFRLRLARLPGKRAKRQRLYPGIALAGKCAVREAR